MTVNTKESEISVATMVFEARFDDGWRYYDRCGEAISRIRLFALSWYPTEISTNTGTLVNRDIQLNTRFDHTRILVGRNDSEWISTSVAGERSPQLAQHAERIYEIVTDALAVPNTIRVGARFKFLAKADSFEDAERFLLRSANSPIGDQVAELTKGDLYTSECQFRVEDPDTGYRQTIRTGTESRINVAQHAMPTGLPGDRSEADTGVTIDIDTFTRPSEGHFQEVSRFLQNSYIRSHEVALKLFHWMHKRQSDKR